MDAEIEPITNGVRLSLSALASEFGYARETIKGRLDRSGVLPDGMRRGNPVFRLRDCIPALTQQSQAGEIENPEALPPMERRAWYASEKDRLISEREKNNLIPAEDHRESLAAVIRPVVQILETLSDVLERDCQLQPDQIERVEQIIDAERERMARQIEDSELVA